MSLLLEYVIAKLDEKHEADRIKRNTKDSRRLLGHSEVLLAVAVSQEKDGAPSEVVDRTVEIAKKFQDTAIDVLNNP